MITSRPIPTAQEVDRSEQRANPDELKKAYETFPATKFIARTPADSGVNDDESTIRAVLAFHSAVCERHRLRAVEVSSFRREQVWVPGSVYGLEDFTPPAPERFTASSDHRRGVRP